MQVCVGFVPTSCALQPVGSLSSFRSLMGEAADMRGRVVDLGYQLVVVTHTGVQDGATWSTVRIP